MLQENQHTKGVDSCALSGAAWPGRAPGAAGVVEALRPGAPRARSHCRFVLPFIHFIPNLLTYSVPQVLKRQCDRTLGVPRTQLQGARRHAQIHRAGGAPSGRCQGCAAHSSLVIYHTLSTVVMIDPPGPRLRCSRPIPRRCTTAARCTPHRSAQLGFRHMR